MPMAKLENGAWQHAHRLPLGCGWTGRCTAPGHDGEIPSSEELHDFCNLGYAEACGRLPREREWDSIRFSARTVGDALENESWRSGRRIQVRYVCERAHRPAGHGFLNFDFGDSRCVEAHSDPRLQRMAECYLESYLEKRKKTDVAAAS
jgi:hypothetical protein